MVQRFSGASTFQRFSGFSKMVLSKHDVICFLYKEQNTKFSFVSLIRCVFDCLTLIDMGGGAESAPPSSFFEVYEKVLEVET